MFEIWFKFGGNELERNPDESLWRGLILATGRGGWPAAIQPAEQLASLRRLRSFRGLRLSLLATVTRFNDELNEHPRKHSSWLVGSFVYAYMRLLVMDVSIIRSQTIPQGQ